MPIQARLTCILSLLALTLLAGCSGEPQPTAGAASAPDAVAADPRPARTLPLPGQTLPQDHPPTETNAPGAGMGWDVPEGWEVEKPASSMRYAQYRVAGATGDAECIVYYFGAGQGGDPMSNAVRWAGQFTQPDGRSSVDLMKITQLEGANVPAQLVEVTGTYDGGMTMTDAPAEKKTGYMLLGGIAQGTDAPWFFKFVGPESTVRAQHAAFARMMESIRIVEP